MTTRTIPGMCKLRVCYENAKGDFNYRWVEIFQSLRDSDADLLQKATQAFRARWGDRQRIVSIDLNTRKHQ
jgi:hypothetical protein